MAIAPDGRIFVCQQGGALRVIKNGALLPTPFISLTVDPNGERGLLGVAFDPNFAGNNFVYVYYTVPIEPRHNRVSRFTANGDVAVPGSETILLELNPLTTASNHNGGAIHFGPDGKLYIATGENATKSNSQTLSNMLGKILRLNSDGSIPTDNPFFNQATGNNRSIWALGLRNPFTFAFQPGTGRMFINDVGESTWEEINDGIAGSNYGWPTTEGPTADPNFRSPLFAYGHGISATTGCAIAGGAFYNPAAVQFPASFVGKYFFADLCSGWIRVFDPANGTVSPFAGGIPQPVDLQIGADGSLYYLSNLSGAVGRIRFNAPAVPDPEILTEQNSDLAIALDSPTMLRDPFAIVNPFNFSTDQRTRLSLFVTHLDLLPGENMSAVTAAAQDSNALVYPLFVESVTPLPGVAGVSQVIVRFHPGMPGNQTIFVTVTLHGQISNTARVRLK
jgi:glucose/arabinose dehydrogenase